MKTFAFDSIERFSRFSETRNIKKVICNKLWKAFNETEDSETYTFMANGTVMIAGNGINLKGTWNFDTKSKKFTIGGKNSTHTFSLIYVDSVITVLKPEGNNNFSFLINENNEEFFHPRFYPDLIKYFRNKYPEVSNSTNDIAQAKTEANSQEDTVEQKTKDDAEELYYQFNDSNRKCGNMVVVSIFIIVYLSMLLYNLIELNQSFSEAILDAFTYGTLINIAVALLFINKIVEKVLDKISIARWKKSNPTDPRNKYL